jgi:hypothetical protein
MVTLPLEQTMVLLVLMQMLQAPALLLQLPRLILPVPGA